jgi:hypothetical protein
VGIKTEVAWFPWNGNESSGGIVASAVHVDPGFRINPQIFVKILPKSDQFGSYLFYNLNAGLQWVRFGSIERKGCDRLLHREAAKWMDFEYSLGFGIGTQFHIEEKLALFLSLGLNCSWVAHEDLVAELRFASGTLFKLF